MSAADWGQLLLFQLSLSLLAVGGAITLAPELHRFLVHEHGWLSEAQFSACVALAQAAPGPNVLYVALLGWQLGLASGGPAWALPGALLCLVGILAPSSLLTLLATRWARRHRERVAVRAFRQGLAPIVVGAMLATAWLLVRGSVGSGAGALHAATPWALAVGATLVVWRTRVHLLWLLAFGALLGALGLA